MAQFEHEDSVMCVQIHNSWVITSSSDKSVKIWDIDTEEELHKLSHSCACYNFDLDHTQSVLAVACQTAVVLWDVKKATKIKEFNLGNKIYDVRFNPVGDTLVAGNGEGEIFKIDLKSGSNNEGQAA